MAVVPSPGVRVAVAESPIRDLGRVSEWWDLWEMKLSVSKTKTVIVSISRTMHPQSPPLTIGNEILKAIQQLELIRHLGFLFAPVNSTGRGVPPSPSTGGTVLKESDDLVILEVTFDSKMTFEKHFRSVSRAASQGLGILRKSWRVLHDRSLLGRYFRCFVFPVLEYCSAGWCSVADKHLKLVDGAVSGARFLTGAVFEYDTAHRRSVAVLCMLYKIRCNPVHPPNGALPGPYVPVRVTRGSLVAHQFTYARPRCRTQQYSRTFIPLSVSL